MFALGVCSLFGVCVFLVLACLLGVVGRCGSAVPFLLWLGWLRACLLAHALVWACWRVRGLCVCLSLRAGVTVWGETTMSRPIWRGAGLLCAWGRREGLGVGVLPRVVNAILLCSLTWSLVGRTVVAWLVGGGGRRARSLARLAHTIPALLA